MTIAIELLPEILVEKIDENWEKVMKETKGAWRKHPVFKDMDDAVEIVNWMRGKAIAAIPGSDIEVKYTSSRIAKRAGEIYAKRLLKNKRSLKRILPYFVIGAHAEQHSDALITWNPSDYNLNIEVMTPSEVIETEQ